MRKLFIATFLLASFLHATTIKSLKFDGLIHLSSEIASEMIEIKKGDIVDIEKFDSAVKMLFGQGYFKDIWVEEVSQGEIVFYFLEKPSVAKIELNGIGENDKEHVLEFLGMKKGEVYDVNKAKLGEKSIEAFYEAKGYFDSVVEHKIEEFNKNALKVIFEVNRGEEIVIEKVDMLGTKELVYSDFEPIIANKEVEILPFIWGFNDGNLNLQDLAYDSARIKDVYMQNGYLDATVSTPFLKAYMDSYTATLAYKIEEGSQYKVGKIDIQLSENIMDVKELKESMRLENGDVFNINKLRKDLKKIKYAVGDKGYAYARVIPDIDKNRKKGIANISLRVILGDKVYINDVIISGNSVTIDRVIRRDVFLSAGDLYSKTDLDDSKRALGRSSYFDKVNIVEKRVSKDKIDLIVNVSEAPTGSISGGLGYGSSDGFLINASLSDSNILGSGMKAGLSLDKSDKEISTKISLTNPKLFDSIYSLGGTLYRQEYEYNEDIFDTEAYDSITMGFNLTLGRRFGRNWRGSLTYAIDDKTYDINTTDENYNDLLKSAITPSVSYNNTDDYYLPRKGSKFSLSYEYAGIGGDAKFMETRVSFSTYYGLKDAIDYDLILRYKAKAYYLQDNGYIPVDDYFTMGGVGSVRGYSSGSIGSISTTASGEAYFSNNMKFVNSIEASFPLIDRLKIRGALFFDYGMIGDGAIDDEIRAGTGVVLEWSSPMGPISLIFAEPLLKEEGDSEARFEFTMGRSF